MPVIYTKNALIDMFYFQQDKNKELREEIEKLKDFTNWENHPALKHKVVLDDDYYLEHLNEHHELIDPYQVSELESEVGELKEEIEKLKEKNSDMLSFIGGNFDYEDKVKEQIKEFYTEEFIKSNEEQWSQVCIDWDDSDFEKALADVKQETDKTVVEENKTVVEENKKLKEENKKLKEQLQYERKISFWRMCESYNGFHKNTNLRHPEWIAEMNAMIEDRWDSNAWCEGTVEELQKGYLEWVGGYQTEEEDEDE